MRDLSLPDDRFGCGPSACNDRHDPPRRTGATTPDRTPTDSLARSSWSGSCHCSPQPPGNQNSYQQASGRLLFPLPLAPTKTLTWPRSAARSRIDLDRLMVSVGIVPGSPSRCAGRETCRRRQAYHAGLLPAAPPGMGRGPGASGNRSVNSVTPRGRDSSGARRPPVPGSEDHVEGEPKALSAVEGRLASRPEFAEALPEHRAVWPLHPCPSGGMVCRGRDRHLPPPGREPEAFVPSRS
jgi:hypothetical protein